MPRKGQRKQVKSSLSRRIRCNGPLCWRDGKSFLSPDPSKVHRCERCEKYLEVQRSGKRPGRPKKEEAAKVKESYCQLCGARTVCRMMFCDTAYLHENRGPGEKLTGHQGKAWLNVCPGCGKEHEAQGGKQ